MNDRYDAIIVGAGPAGCTAAAILAEAGYSVLLVEQLQRAHFNRLRFAMAARSGAECHDQTRVLDVLFSGHCAAGVCLRRRGERRRTIHARVVIDASGRQALLAHRLCLQPHGERGKKAAIWGHYRGASRDRNKNDMAQVFRHPRSQSSWFWFMPLAPEITSMGVVGDWSYLLQGRGKPEVVFEDELVRCPELAERLMNATLMHEFRLVKELNYFHLQQAGEGWVLVGDAWGFIDPIYVSDELIAVRSAELAARAVIDGLRSGDVSAARLGAGAAEFHLGMPWVRKLVTAFDGAEFRIGTLRREFAR